MKRMLFGCSLLLSSYFVFGQDQPLLLDGKIDKYPIVMEITIYDTTCDIRYFYLNQKKDIRLEGTVNGNGEIKAKSPDRGDKNMIKEKIDLKKIASGYTGTWINNKKRLIITLKETSADKYSNQYEYLSGIKELKKEYPYDYIKTADFAFTKELTSKNGVAEIEWNTEKYSAIRMPRIKSFYFSSVLQKINTVLLERHLIESKNFLECSSGAFGEYNLSVDPIFGHENILSINIIISYYCGGAHPDFASEGLNFDGHTGELLKLDKTFWFGKTEPPAEDSDKWYSYRDGVFAPKIVELFRSIYPDQMKPPRESDEQQCDFTDPEVWDFPNWYFTEKGLYFGAVFGRVARVCDQPEWSVIPYKLLTPYLNPNAKVKLPE